MTISVRILRWIYRLQRMAYRHRRYSLSMVAVLVALVGWAAQDVRTSNDPLLFFSEHNFHRQQLESIQDVFGDTKTTLIVLDAKEAGAPIVMLEAERYLTGILLDADNPLHIDHLEKLGSLTAVLPDIGYPLEYTPIEDVPSLVADFPVLSTYYFNKDLSATVLLLALNNADQSDMALRGAFAELDGLVSHMQEKYPALEVSSVGNVALFEAMRSAFEKDKRFLFPATVVVNFLVLLFAFGNIRVTASVLVVAVISVVLTQGVAGWSGYVFSSGSASSFSIVLTLTVASLIHVVHAMGQRQRRLPFQQSETIILSSFRKLTVPVILAHITTAVGFLSLNFADAPAFQSMGNLVAIGLVFSLMLSLFVAPIVFKSRRNELVIRDSRVRAMSLWLATAWANAPVRYGVLVTVLSLMALAGLGRIVFDDQIIKNFSSDHTLVVNTGKVVDAIGWSHSIDLVLKYDEDTLVTPQNIAKIADLIDWLKDQNPVAGVISPMPLITDCLATRTPPYEGALVDVPPKMLNFCVRSRASGAQAVFFNEDFRQIDLKILLPSTSALTVRVLTEKINDKVIALGFTDQTAVVSGVAVMSAYLTKVNTQSMLVGSAIAMLIVSILIGLFLRSPALAVLSILPNFLPAMASLGLWVWINTEVGMAASVIASVTFGIVVDDTIHILYALSRGKNTTTRSGVRTVLRNVTPGVLTTTATLGLGFAVLMFSGFEVTRQLGFLTSITIGIAFLFDIFVLPGLYRLFIGKKR